MEQQIKTNRYENFDEFQGESIQNRHGLVFKDRKDFIIKWNYTFSKNCKPLGELR